MRGAGPCRRRTQANRKEITKSSKSRSKYYRPIIILTIPDTNLDASTRHGACCRDQSRKKAARRSPLGRATARGRVTLVSSTPRGRGAGSASLGRGVEGAERRQQGLRSTLDSFGSSSGARGIHGHRQDGEGGGGGEEGEGARQCGPASKTKNESEVGEW